MEFGRQIQEIPAGEPLTVRINTPGGAVRQCYAMLSILSDRAGAVTSYVDGTAYSMGAFFCAFSSKVIASELSRFMIHKAAYPEWVQIGPEEEADLKDINDTLRARLKNKLNDTPEAKQLLKKVFSKEGRADVFLNAKTAKKIGLVDEIKKISLSGATAEAFALSNEDTNALVFSETSLTEEQQPNIKIMDLAEFKSQHADLYAQILKEGSTAEKKRAGAYLPFLNSSPEAAIKGIEGDEKLEGRALSELMIKAVKGSTTEEDEAAANAEDVSLNTEKKTSKELNADKMEEAMKQFGK